MNLSTNETFPTNETPPMNETLPMNETIGAATVLVTGGNGFIGRHIVKHLHRFGASVLVSTSNRKTAGRDSHARHLALHRVRTPEQWLEHLEGVDIVVNAVGILRERLFESYEQVHHHALDALATACAEKGVTLVHVSILGVDSPARSRFVKSKLRGEEAIKKSTANWFIVRPSLVDGVGGNGAKWFRRVAAWPVHFAGGRCRRQRGKVVPSRCRVAGSFLQGKAVTFRPPTRKVDSLPSMLTILEKPWRESH